MLRSHKVLINIQFLEFYRFDLIHIDNGFKHFRYAFKAIYEKGFLRISGASFVLKQLERQVRFLKHLTWLLLALGLFIPL